MFNSTKAQIEKKNDLIKRAESIVNLAETEKRELTPDEAQELAEIRDDVKKIKEFLEITDEIDEARACGDVAPEKKPEREAEGETRELMETRAFEAPYCGKLQLDRLVEGLIAIDYKGVFTFESDGFLNKFNCNGKLKTLPLELRKSALKLLFEIGKFALESCNIFEN